MYIIKAENTFRSDNRGADKKAEEARNGGELQRKTEKRRVVNANAVNHDVDECKFTITETKRAIRDEQALAKVKGGGTREKSHFARSVVQKTSKGQQELFGGVTVGLYDAEEGGEGEGNGETTWGWTTDRGVDRCRT